MTNEEIETMIARGLPGSEAHVSGDGTHFYAKVICQAFEGLPLIKQHRMVYGAVGDSMQGAIHALSIQTYTPEEWARQKPFETL
jgi:acid stress-induced BolA-like protein IbaG/YrbA